MLGVGVLFSDELSMEFRSTVTFEENVGSAIYITAGRVHILPMAALTISRNKADRGAGMALMGYAGLTAHEGSTVIFDNNYAKKVGGAIYYGTIDKLDYINSRRCFIRYSHVVPPDQWDAGFFFVNNSAGDRGYSIYASSLLPCARATFNYTENDFNLFTVFRWKPTFYYDPPFRALDISTDTSNISLSDDDTQMFPGLQFQLPIVTTDELHNNVSTVFQTVKNDASNDSCDISGSFQYVSNRVIQIDGYEGSWINFTLRSVSDRQVGLTVVANLTQCPPGYILDPDNHICVCSTSTDTPYDGIVACNETRNQGVLKNGYWAGCLEGDRGPLLTAPCPLGYCANPQTSAGDYLLPSDCSGLSDFFCGPQNRSGLLCGNCADNFTVYYHSNRFRCGSCTLPELGIPLYIISELLPLTLLFIIVILFGVSLTSGAANSFILFAQILDFFEVTAFGSIHFPQTIQMIADIYRFLFGFLNLDFFRLDILSFCLFKHANVLDILAFKYVTALYGIMLIGVLALLMRFCHCRDRRNAGAGAHILQRVACSVCLLVSKAINNPGHAIIHGITAFFIITYSQLAKVSLEILTETTLRTKKFEPVQDVVFLSGTTEFFSGEHLKYAIPAVLVMLYAFLVPLVLIVHPLYFLCKRCRPRNQMDVSNSVIFWRKRCCCPSSRELNLLLKPFFDAFQSCFKDSMRFFGGIYFVYRLAIAGCMAFSHSAIEMYGSLEIVLIIMLTIHAIFQPYEHRFFNILDSLMFACLAIINGISLYNYADTLYIYQGRESYFIVTASIQLILVYAPIVYMVIFVILKVLCWYRPMRKILRLLNHYIPLFDPRDDEEHERLDDGDVEDGRFDDGNLPARLFEEREGINRDGELMQEAPPVRGRQRQTFPGVYGAVANTT